MVQAAQTVSVFYRTARLQLRHDRFLQLPLFLASLPFAPSRDLMENMECIMRIRILKSSAASTLIPAFGDYKSNSDGTGLLLTIRSGRIFNFDPFQLSGNYTVSVVGASGSGKSVLMQELAVGIYNSSGRFLMIDDGYSSSTTYDLPDGSFISFRPETQHCLNPFDLINARDIDQDAYFNEALELISSMVVMMADLSGAETTRVAKVEEDLILRAVKQVWQEHGSSGSISKVQSCLKTF